ncbi:MAG: tRNA-dependent cyclodipeptide synthase [Cyanobacteria bacterium P01_A01_bin.123]
MAAFALSKTNALDPIKDLLDSQKIRYLTVSYSPAYTLQDIAVDEFSLGYELIEAVLICTAPNRYAMIVVPVTRKIELDSLRVSLNNPNIDFVGKGQTQKLFPDYEIGTLPPLGCLFNLEVFFTQELHIFQEISFCVQSQAQRIRMSFEDYRCVAKPHQNIEIKTSARYEAQVVTVKPESALGQLQKYETCMLGFSLQDKNFTTAKLAGMTEWISQNFSNCQVLIGDLAYQIVLEMQGFSEQHALNRAISFGRKIRDEKLSIFDRYADHCCFEMRFFSDVLAEEKFQAYAEEIRWLFEADKTFSTAVRNFADVFVKRYLQQDSQRFDYYVNRSCIYLLEELAIYAYVAEQEASTFVYPDASSGFQSITQILHPTAPEPLRNLVHISLRLRPR